MKPKAAYIEKLGIKTVFTEAERLSVAEFSRIQKMLNCECIAEKAEQSASHPRTYPKDAADTSAECTTEDISSAYTEPEKHTSNTPNTP